jgi:hypothetical protein
MKSALLISTVVAILAAPAAASPSSAGRTLPGFRSPTGNIKCYYNPKGLTSRGFSPVVRCSLDHADYGMTLQRRCSVGDWHGWTLTPRLRPLLFCPAGATADHPQYRTLDYGKERQLGQFVCSSRTIGVTCRNRAGHGLFVSRQNYRVW